MNNGKQKRNHLFFIRSPSTQAFTCIAFAPIWKLVAFQRQGQVGPRNSKKNQIRITKSPKQRKSYMVIGMRHAFHFALACVSINDICRIKEKGTLSQHLAEWSSPIQFDTRKNIFIYWIEPGARRKVFKKNNNLFKQVKPWGKPRLFFYFQKWAFDKNRAPG